MEEDRSPILFSCSSRPDQAEAFANRYGLTLGRAEFTRFKDGEIHLDIKEPSVYGRDCFVFQTFCEPLHEHMMEIFLMGDALKNAGANSITAIVPYLGYMRQDRRTTEQGPVSIALLARLLKASGYDVVRTWGLHNSAIEGVFACAGIRLLNTQTVINSGQFMSVLQHNIMPYTEGEQKRIVLVAPDAGASKPIAKLLYELRELLAEFKEEMDGIAQIPEIEMASGYKNRLGTGKVEVLDVSGDVAGKDCVVVDDIIDGGGTLCQVASLIEEKGAKSVCGVAVHGVFSPGVMDNLFSSPISRLILLDTIPWWKREWNGYKIEETDEEHYKEFKITKSSQSGQHSDGANNKELSILERRLRIWEQDIT